MLRAETTASDPPERALVERRYDNVTRDMLDGMRLAQAPGQWLPFVGTNMASWSTDYCTRRPSLLADENPLSFSNVSTATWLSLRGRV